VNLSTATSELARHTIWPLDRIKDHSWKIGSGITPSGGATSYLDAGIPLLRSQNIHHDGIHLEDVAFIGEDVHANMANTRLQEGDVLLNITGASIGRCTFVPKGFGEGNVNQHVCIIRPSARLDHQYLSYCLAAPWGQDQILSGFTGASRQGLGQRELGEIQVPFPPFPEQKRIVTYLDASCAAIDAAVAAKRRQIETLDGIRKITIQRAVTRGIEEHPKLRETGNVWMEKVPSNWELVSLKRISAVQTGLTLGKVYEGHLVERPYLRVANVQDGHLDLNEVTTIEVSEEVAQRVTLRAGDVLMTEGGDLDKLGRGTIWSGEIEDCLHQNHIFAVRCFKHKLLPRFLAFLTASQYGRDYFEATGKRTTNLASTNSTKVGLFPIPRPSTKEQHVISDFLDARLAHIGKIVNGIEFQIVTLNLYRKSLIHECVTGQRRDTDEDVKRAEAQWPSARNLQN
jgi:type I restriction enzyme, S subunit